MYLRKYTSIIYTTDEGNAMGFTAETILDRKLNIPLLLEQCFHTLSGSIESLTKNRVFASLKNKR